VYLGSNDRTVRKPDICDPFTFSPAPATIAFSQPRNFANSRTSGDRLDVCQITCKLNVHGESLQTKACGSIEADQSA